MLDFKAGEKSVQREHDIGTCMSLPSTFQLAFCKNRNKRKNSFDVSLTYVIWHKVCRALH